MAKRMMKRREKGWGMNDHFRALQGELDGGQTGKQGLGGMDNRRGCGWVKWTRLWKKEMRCLYNDIHGLYMDVIQNTRCASRKRYGEVEWKMFVSTRYSFDLGLMWIWILPQWIVIPPLWLHFYPCPVNCALFKNPFKPPGCTKCDPRLWDLSARQFGGQSRCCVALWENS